MKTRKELKDEYKQTKFRMGVFAIRNLTNGKRYIGRATNLDLIWNAEKFKLNLGGHPNYLLQEEWKTSGADNFVYEVLHELAHADDPTIDARAELKTLEELTIEELQPFGERGYHKQR